MTNETARQEFTICSCCGKQVSTNQIELCFRRPDPYLLVPLDELANRTWGNDDLCVIKGKNDSPDRFFVRGLLPILVKDWDAPYSIGVWIELAGPDFDRIYDLWDEDDQASEPAFAAKLANAIPLHTSSYGLAGLLSLTGPMTRPTFQLSKTANTLFDEQSNGISAHRASQYADIVPK